MRYDAIVAGTGFEGRANKIRLCAKPGTEIVLSPEPNNPYDPNAIAVYLKVRGWYSLFMKVEVQIGYIKKRLAASLTKRLAEGGQILAAEVKSLYLPLDHPRVTIAIYTDW
ncbi:HIRAN domain-containing protein [Marinobacter qingdaonensis]|uniref:HIRAN domain-containing protein n=1 Tax=Marinobacter qingdaonensis TaxID=3108486 RepID=A0ABU5P1Q8_9GAMM|nr:HIRAN domain-containing protein [Marinobacter sp. ASW11-75]MEA1081969.1 HIRAN domain-containing protein [Marinobacter sp. ASW11-75]